VLMVTGIVDAWTVAPAAVASVAIPLYVLLGFRAAEAPASSYRALLGAPRLVLRKVAKAYRLRGFHPDNWVRTERRRD
jgi:hypothetical protein